MPAARKRPVRARLALRDVQPRLLGHALDDISLLQKAIASVSRASLYRYLSENRIAALQRSERPLLSRPDGPVARVSVDIWF
jgi:hypothetical protein